MKELSFLTTTEQETIALGRKMAKFLRAGDIICLEGELGSGKTTFVKGLGQGLGVDQSSVHSPTFVVMNIYQGKLPVYHFDLYRLDDLQQIQTIDCEEYFYGNGVSLIEWAEKLKGMAPKEYLRIRLSHVSPHERRLEIDAQGERYQKLYEQVKSLR